MRENATASAIKNEVTYGCVLFVQSGWVAPYLVLLAECLPAGCRTAVKPYETLVLWLVLFVCAAGIAACPIAFADLWAKRWFKISYFIVLSFLVIIALRAVAIQGRPWIGF
jgi:hypothetical protein